MGWSATRRHFSPQITVDAPIMIPEDYVPDLAVRMALYRRLNDAEDKAEIEAGRRDDRPLRPAAAADRRTSSS
jgi:transcription-repair coupling factor (superfamily II helicase)